MKEKLNQLQEAIIELVPEKRTQSYFLHELRQYNILEDWANQCPDENAFEEAMFLYTGIDDITIADVLLAINLAKKEKLHYTIVDNGRFVTIGDMVMGMDVAWNLTEPLHLQDESVINFLHDVICQEK